MSFAPMATSQFEHLELERRRLRVALLDRVAEGREKWVQRNRYYTKELHRVIGTMIDSTSRVLEVGCGLGDLLAALGPRGVGIDLSPRMIELGKKRHPGLDLRVCDVESDPLPEGPFDFVVLSDTVGHLDDIERAFERLKPLLAPHPSIESAHPSPLSAHNGFFGSRPFSRANALLAEQGAEPIDWRLP